jgi:hypothetical protein
MHGTLSGNNFSTRQQGFIALKLDAITRMTLLTATKRLIATDVVIGIAIIQAINQRRRCWAMSDAHLSKALGQNIRTIQRSRARLRACGIIDWRGTKSVNRYWLVGFEPVAQKPQSDTGVAPQNDTGVACYTLPLTREVGLVEKESPRTKTECVSRATTHTKVFEDKRYGGDAGQTSHAPPSRPATLSPQAPSSVSRSKDAAPPCKVTAPASHPDVLTIEQFAAQAITNQSIAEGVARHAVAAGMSDETAKHEFERWVAYNAGQPAHHKLRWFIFWENWCGKWHEKQADKLEKVFDPIAMRWRTANEPTGSSIV